MPTTPRWSAWAISAGAHLTFALVITLAATVGRRDRGAPPPARLVYVEPVPAALDADAAAVDAAAGRAAQQAAAAVPPPAAPPHPEISRPDAVPPSRATSARALRHAPASLASHVEARPARSDSTAADTEPSHDGRSTPGGVALGTATGEPNGAVGGLGAAPLALRDVAAAPELLERVLPEYPPRARTMQVEGQVMLEVVLDRDGRIEDTIRVTRSIPALDAAAVSAVRRWRFRPARDREGHPVRVVMEIPVRFVLR